MESLVSEGGSTDLSSLDLVIRETVKTLENGKNQLFTVAEHARNEHSRLSEALVEINNKLADIYRELGFIIDVERQARVRVESVTGNFEGHTEEEIKTAYEGAKELQVRLTLLRERKSQLENKKQELEASLSGVGATAEKAESMVSQVGIVEDFIRGSLRDINLRLENLQQRQQMGLQIIKAQEEERKRVAREIHDGPAQSMANVVLRMEFCEKLMDVEPDRVRRELRELKEIVRSNLQDVRKIIFDLRPMALDDLGVVPTLKRFLADFTEKNCIPVELDFRGRESRLEPVLEIALFRLVQEALNNVVKHSRATLVKINLEMMPDMVKVTIRDNGVGFLLEKAMGGHLASKFGLISMKERTDLLSGEMDITTGPGKGTKVSFRIPVTG